MSPGCAVSGDVGRQESIAPPRATSQRSPVSPVPGLQDQWASVSQRAQNWDRTTVAGDARVS